MTRMAKSRALMTELGLNTAFVMCKPCNFGQFNLSKCHILHLQNGKNNNSYLILFKGLHVFCPGHILNAQ